MAEGHAWQGVCVAGEMVGREHVWQEVCMCGSRDGHCSRWYMLGCGSTHLINMHEHP